MESPLRCADCFAPVPLYRIPYTSWCDTHEDIVNWRRNYQHCDGLQIRCAVGERFGTRQLSRLDSDLSKEGIECCQRVTAVTRRPCYYYLYRYHGRSKKREAKRTCPSCGRGWGLKEAWHGQFDFRCDRCRLLSNIAYSVS
jgi:predicted  nucleic acid-binding Zn ribbon protein